MKKRPITTLFMLESLDGKISSGNLEEMIQSEKKTDNNFIYVRIS